MAKKKKAVRRKKQAAGSKGLSPAETRTASGAADALAPLVERRGDTYARTGISEATLPERWVGGVRLPARRARPAQAT